MNRPKDVRGAVCLVTGASSGIGEAASRQLASMGCRVLMVGRSEERTDAAAARVEADCGVRPEVLLADFSNLSQVRDLASHVGDVSDRVDVLVNNAGLISQKRVVTEDGNELTFQVNHLAPFLLTSLLSDVLVASGRARVVTVSSSTHRRAGRGIRFDDLSFERAYDGFAAYAHSKLANVMFAYELARRSAPLPVTSTVVNPGLVGTNFGMADFGVVRLFYSLLRPFIRTAEEGARPVVTCAADEALEGVTGAYFDKLRRKRSSRVSYDQDAWERLWEVSEELTAAWRS